MGIEYRKLRKLLNTELAFPELLHAGLLRKVLNTEADCQIYVGWKTREEWGENRLA